MFPVEITYASVRKGWYIPYIVNQLFMKRHSWLTFYEKLINDVDLIYVRVLPNTVFAMGPNCYMSLEDGRIFISPYS